jgi:hypothetical protein
MTDLGAEVFAPPGLQLACGFAAVDVFLLAFGDGIDLAMRYGVL